MAITMESNDDMILKQVLYTQAKVDALVEFTAKILSNQSGQKWEDIAKEIDERSAKILADHLK